MKLLWIMGCIGMAFNAADNFVAPDTHWAYLVLSGLAVFGWLYAAVQAWRQPVAWL